MENQQPHLTVHILEPEMTDRNRSIPLVGSAFTWREGGPEAAEAVETLYASLGLERDAVLVIRGKKGERSYRGHTLEPERAQRFIQEFSA